MATTADSTSNLDTVRNQIKVDYREFRSAAKMWSGVYYSFQFGSAALTAAAALVLKIDLIGAVSLRNDLGAIITAVATLSITLLTTGRFKDKWEANRIAAFAVRDLGYEINKSNPNCDAILTALQGIGLTRNNTIVGLPTELKLKPTTEGAPDPTASPPPAPESVHTNRDN